MNDETLTQLKVVVERAVRPVRATAVHKRKMREELLAHLVSIFEEEAERLGDEQAALEQASKRFGDPRELSAELQTTVPRWDRFRSILDNAWQFGPGESLFHFGGKQLLFMGVPYAFLPLVLLPILVARGKQADYGVACYALFVTCIAMAALSFAIVLLPFEMGRSLYGRDSERSVLRAALCGLASLFILPAFAFLTYGMLTWDLSASLANLRFACYFAPAAPVVLVMMSRKVLEERRYEEEWASLVLDQ